MLKQLLSIPLLFSLSVCSDEPSPEVKALLKQTEKNMVFVKGGSFMMGDPGAIEDGKGGWILGSPENRKKYPDAPWLPITMGTDDDFVHKITLSDFYMQKYEVTWGEFDVYSVANGKELADKEYIGNKKRSSNYVANPPSWYEAKNYCLWLGKETGKNYDLPTEAQWEYAARSRGQYVAFATNDGEGRKNKYRYKEPKNGAKDEVNISPDRWSLPGTYPKNPLGLYDMTGNSTEWLNDWYDKDYYQNSPESNPQGPSKGQYKVIKDGSSNSLPFMTLYKRSKGKPTANSIGFRCVINP